MGKIISSATEILELVTGDNPELRRMIEEETLNSKIAQMIYDVRHEAGLTQAGLAKLINTKQPVIARLEDADYEGHSLSMLQRIATALGQRLHVSFVPGTGTDG